MLAYPEVSGVSPADRSALTAHLRPVDAAVPLQLPDVVLLHPPPGVLRVPVRRSLHLRAHVLARPSQNERLAARVHPQESGHVVHPGPQQHPAGVLGAVAGHLPLREEPGGRGRRHPDSGGARHPPEVTAKRSGEQRHLPGGPSAWLQRWQLNFAVTTRSQQNS